MKTQTTEVTRPLFATMRFVSIEVAVASTLCGILVIAFGNISETSMRVGLTVAGLFLVGAETWRQFPAVRRRVRASVRNPIAQLVNDTSRHGISSIVKRIESLEQAETEKFHYVRMFLTQLDTRVDILGREIKECSDIVVQLEIRLAGLSSRIEAIKRSEIENISWLPRELTRDTWHDLEPPTAAVIPLLDQLIHNFQPPRYSPWFEQEHYLLFHFETADAWLRDANSRRSIVVFLTNTVAPSLRTIRTRAKHSADSPDELRQLVIDFLTQLSRESRE